MKVQFTHWYNALLAALFTLLGFGSCSKSLDDPDGPMICEYGVPNISFQVKGQIKTEDGAHIKGIRVVAIPTNNYLGGRDTVYTDAEGKFSTKKLYSSSERYLKEDLVVMFEDVDGEANGGTFEKSSLKGTQVTIVQKEKGSGWNRGYFEVTADKKLKKQKK